RAARGGCGAAWLSVAVHGAGPDAVLGDPVDQARRPATTVPVLDDHALVRGAHRGTPGDPGPGPPTGPGPSGVGGHRAAPAVLRSPGAGDRRHLGTVPRHGHRAGLAGTLPVRGS